MWNKQKIKFIFSNDTKPLTEEEMWANEALKRKKDIEKIWNDGQDKIACLMMDVFYDDIPKQYHAKIKEIIETEGGF